jgi:DNA invertase Pin-like site-specific DNA recombinase
LNFIKSESEPILQAEWQPGYQRRQGTRQAPWPQQADASGRPTQELHAKGVDLYLHQQGLDTSTPSGQAMFQMLGVFAEFERSMIRERVMVGLARAKADGTRLGRPATVADDAAKVQTIRAARAAGKSIRTIAREQEVGIGTVSRLTG